MTPSRRGDPAATLPHVPADDSPTPPPELANHPRYRLAEVLGEGGMGTVYRAEHRLMKRWVALKVVRHALLERPVIRERFLSELRTSARLTHPNIVVAHDAEEAGAVCFLVMEYVAGEDLATLVRRRGPLPVAEACGYVRQAAVGLQHAHECGLVHRDIKPANLMLTPDGRVKILDFGLARLALEKADADQAAAEVPAVPAASLGDKNTLSQAAPHTATGSVLGTPAYMAPEQARDPRSADVRSDIYSLGCSLVHLLAGRPTVAPRPGTRSDLPPGLAAVLGRMLAAAPEDRYQTPAEAEAALAPFAGTEALQEKRSVPRLRLLIRAAVTLMCVCMAVFLVLYLRYAPAPPEARPAGPKNEKEVGSPVYDDPRAPTYVSLVADPNPTLFESKSTLTAKVRPRPNNVGVPEGKVTFRSGDEVLCEAPLEDGRATWTITASESGERELTAAYGGDKVYLASTSPAITFRVGVGAVHRITVVSPTPGTFRLTFNGMKSPSLPTTASAAQVQAALNNLATISGVDGNVSVAQEPDGYTVTFVGSLGAKKVPLLQATGLGGVQVSVVALREGAKP